MDIAECPGYGRKSWNFILKMHFTFLCSRGCCVLVTAHFSNVKLHNLISYFFQFSLTCHSASKNLFLRTSIIWSSSSKNTKCHFIIFYFHVNSKNHQTSLKMQLGIYLLNKNVGKPLLDFGSESFLFCQYNYFQNDTRNKMSGFLALAVSTQLCSFSCVLCINSFDKIVTKKWQT